MKILDKTEAYFAPIGRIIMGAFFLLSGISKVLDLSGTADYIATAGFPAASLLTIVAVAVEVGLGGMLMAGFKPRFAALFLAAFTLFITFPFHGPQLWASSPVDQIMFMKNLVIVGALLFMAAHAGRFADHNETNKKPIVPRPTL